MASFIMKQMMGSQLDKVKELTGGDGDKKDGGNDEEDPELNVNALFLSAPSSSNTTRRLSLAPLFTKSTPSSPSLTPATPRRKSMVESAAVTEARREAEEKRDAKYAKMERQREEVRQSIREKYNIQKKEEAASLPPPCEGRLTADKKGPIPLPDDDDSFDPVKMATNALNTIADKLPFKLPWK
ncbi:unnamed protein product [Rotaria sordida]|uniref:Complexin n=1 Tax=Rotaria sordida TaxID=392033 RepID=A0A819QAY2_9BILA|nr:unnamed protein product [Rotaria sordida]CAF1284478.1 unnamed protein product [Rotaria sordida]CAF1284840.1 unnamed protein product [Rotaria sordida]CAF3784500.1 unnamed protein product [Rotaria sordida]CAF3834261.1 unnamed protein product [Rotaria sordida]